MRGKGLIQLRSKRLNVRQRITCSSVLVRRNHPEEAKELLESVSAEGGSQQRMCELAAPVQPRPRQPVDTHEEMRAQEGIQLGSSSGPPVVRRGGIGVLRKLLHQAQRQE